jgi:hypothetical protein
LFVFIIFIAGSLPSSGSIIDEKDYGKNEFLNHGWIEEYDDFKLLYLKGSYYEMGYQHGRLLADEIEENFRAFLNYTEIFGWDYNFYVWYWNEIKENIPYEYMSEMKGIADGSGLPLINISINNIMADWFHCCEAATWGPATSNGKLIHLRSFDWAMEMIDPISGKGLRENQILMVRDPDSNYASIEPSFSGLIGGPGGINENGIGIGILCSYCFDEINSTHVEGIPVTFRIKMVLDRASNINEALEIINSNKTCGFNFIISDKDKAYATEQTLSLSYNGTWDDPIESTNPFWSIDHVVRRTNIFINPILAKYQRKYYNPSIFPLLMMFFKINPIGYKSIFSSSTSWLHYRALSNEIEKLWGNLNLNNSMELLRNLYLGKSDIRFFIIQKIGYYIPLHQWVAYPETGDILISFADSETDAHRNQVYHFNLFELL